MTTFDSFFAHTEALTWSVVTLAILGLIVYLYTLVRG